MSFSVPIHLINSVTRQITKLSFIHGRMHNLVQELRGNVRVFARIRPFLPDDHVSDDTSPIIPNGENAIKVVSFESCKRAHKLILFSSLSNYL